MKIIKIVVSGYRSLEDNFTIDFLSLDSRKYPRSDNETTKIFTHVRAPICHLFTGRHGHGKTTVLALLHFCYELITDRRVTYNKLDFNQNKIELTIYIAHHEMMYTYNCSVYPPNAFKFGQQYCRIERHNLTYKRIKKFHPSSFYKGTFYQYNDLETEIFELPPIFYLESNLSKLEMLKRIAALYKYIDNRILLNFVRIFDLTIKKFKLSEDGEHFFIKMDTSTMKISIIELADIFSSGTIKGVLLHMLTYFTIHLGSVLIVDDIEIYLKLSIVKNIIGLFINPTINVKGAQIYFSTLSDEVIDMFSRVESIHIMNKEAGKITVQSLSNFYNFPIKGTRSKSKLFNKIDIVNNGDYEFTQELLTLMLR